LNDSVLKAAEAALKESWRCHDPLLPHER
jgi:hypothetical protein